jgi:hypothetical protein
VSDILWLLALLGVVLLGDYSAVLLVRAEQREQNRVDAERRRSASLRRPGLGVSRVSDGRTALSSHDRSPLKERNYVHNQRWFLVRHR